MIMPLFRKKQVKQPPQAHPGAPATKDTGSSGVKGEDRSATPMRKNSQKKIAGPRSSLPIPFVSVRSSSGGHSTQSPTLDNADIVASERNADALAPLPKGDSRRRTARARAGGSDRKKGVRASSVRNPFESFGSDSDGESDAISSVTHSFAVNGEAAAIESEGEDDDDYDSYGAIIGGAGKAIRPASAAHRGKKKIPISARLRKDVDLLKDPSCTPPDAARILGSLAATLTSPRGRIVIVAAGAVPALLVVMGHHVDSVTVQERGCAALQNLAVDPEERRAIGLGGVLAVLSAMKRHIDIRSVQEFGCGALRNLGLDHVGNKSAIAMGGGVLVIVEALRRHCSDSRVATQSLRALRNFTKGGGADGRLAIQNALSGIVDAMAEHADVESVQSEGCANLRNLSIAEDQQEAVGSAGGIPVILSAMEVHPESERVQKQGCGALYNLSFNADNLRQMEGNELCHRVAKHAAKEYPRSCKEYCDGIFYRMAASPVSRRSSATVILRSGANCVVTPIKKVWSSEMDDAESASFNVMEEVMPALSPNIDHTHNEGSKQSSEGSDCGFSISAASNLEETLSEDGIDPLQSADSLQSVDSETWSLNDMFLDQSKQVEDDSTHRQLNVVTPSTWDNLKLNKDQFTSDQNIALDKGKEEHFTTDSRSSDALLEEYEDQDANVLNVDLDDSSSFLNQSSHSHIKMGGKLPSTPSSSPPPPPPKDEDNCSEVGHEFPAVMTDFTETGLRGHIEPNHTDSSGDLYLSEEEVKGNSGPARAAQESSTEENLPLETEEQNGCTEGSLEASSHCGDSELVFSSTKVILSEHKHQHQFDLKEQIDISVLGELSGNSLGTESSIQHHTDEDVCSKESESSLDYDAPQSNTEDNIEKIAEPSSKESDLPHLRDGTDGSNDIIELPQEGTSDQNTKKGLTEESAKSSCELSSVDSENDTVYEEISGENLGVDGPISHLNQDDRVNECVLLADHDVHQSNTREDSEKIDSHCHQSNMLHLTDEHVASNDVYELPQIETSDQDSIKVLLEDGDQEDDAVHGKLCEEKFRNISPLHHSNLDDHHDTPHSNTEEETRNAAELSDNEPDLPHPTGEKFPLNDVDKLPQEKTSGQDSIKEETEKVSNELNSADHEVGTTSTMDERLAPLHVWNQGISSERFLQPTIVTSESDKSQSRFGEELVGDGESGNPGHKDISALNSDSPRQELSDIKIEPTLLDETSSTGVGKASQLEKVDSQKQCHIEGPPEEVPVESDEIGRTLNSNETSGQSLNKDIPLQLSPSEDSLSGKGCLTESAKGENHIDHKLHEDGDNGQFKKNSADQERNHTPDDEKPRNHSSDESVLQDGEGILQQQDHNVEGQSESGIKMIDDLTLKITLPPDVSAVENEPCDDIVSNNLELSSVDMEENSISHVEEPCDQNPAGEVLKDGIEVLPHDDDKIERLLTEKTEEIKAPEIKREGLLGFFARKERDNQPKSNIEQALPPNVSTTKKNFVEDSADGQLQKVYANKKKHPSPSDSDLRDQQSAEVVLQDNEDWSINEPKKLEIPEKRRGGEGLLGFWGRRERDIKVTPNITSESSLPREEENGQVENLSAREEDNSINGDGESCEKKSGLEEQEGNNNGGVSTDEVRQTKLPEKKKEGEGLLGFWARRDKEIKPALDEASKELSPQDGSDAAGVAGLASAWGFFRREREQAESIETNVEEEHEEGEEEVEVMKEELLETKDSSGVRLADILSAPLSELSGHISSVDTSGQIVSLSTNGQTAEEGYDLEAVPTEILSERGLGMIEKELERFIYEIYNRKTRGSHDDLDFDPASKSAAEALSRSFRGRKISMKGNTSNFCFLSEDSQDRFEQALTVYTTHMFIGEGSDSQEAVIKVRNATAVAVLSLAEKEEKAAIYDPIPLDSKASENIIKEALMSYARRISSMHDSVDATALTHKYDGEENEMVLSQTSTAFSKGSGNFNEKLSEPNPPMMETIRVNNSFLHSRLAVDIAATGFPRENNTGNNDISGEGPYSRESLKLNSSDQYSAAVNSEQSRNALQQDHSSYMSKSSHGEEHSYLESPGYNRGYANDSLTHVFQQGLFPDIDISPQKQTNLGDPQKQTNLGDPQKHTDFGDSKASSQTHTGLMRPALPPLLSSKKVHGKLKLHRDLSYLKDSRCTSKNAASIIGALANASLKPGSRHTIVAAGAIPALLDAMEHHIETVSVQERGCMTLQNIAAEAQMRSKIASVGGIAAILSAMKHHPKEGKVQLQGCGALRNMGLDNVQNKSIISSSGGILAIIEAIRHSRSDARVVDQAFRTLRNLAKDGANNRVAIAGALPIIIDVMKEHLESESVQREVCATLRNLSVTEDLQLAVAAAGGVSALVSTMQEHPKNDRVQTQACGVLYNLSCCPGNLAIMKKDKRCKATLKHAAKKFPESGGRYANKLLDRIASCPKGQVSTPVLDMVQLQSPHYEQNERPKSSSIMILQHVQTLRIGIDTVSENEAAKVISELGLLAEGKAQGHNTAIIAADGIPVITAFMTRRVNSLAIQHASLEALQILASQDSGNCPAIVKAGGINAVVEAMSKHVKRNEIQMVGCIVFQSLMAEETDRTESSYLLCREGGVLAVKDAMKAHRKNERVQENACKALSVLSQVSETNCIEIAKAGCIPLVLLALRSHPETPEVQFWGCQLLYHLSFNSTLVGMMRNQKPEQLLWNAAGRYPMHCGEWCRHLLEKLSS